MANIEETWLRTRIEKLERRLSHQRDAGRDLMHDSIIRIMNDRAIMDMELKLFDLKRQMGEPWPGQHAVSR